MTQNKESTAETTDLAGETGTRCILFRVEALGNPLGQSLHTLLQDACALHVLGPWGAKVHVFHVPGPWDGKLNALKFPWGTTLQTFLRVTGSWGAK